MAAFATSDDVESRWRPLTEEESSVVDTLLDDASDMIRDRWPDVDDRISANTLRESSVIRIVSSMVKRALDRPPGTEGLESFTQGAGPFSFGGTLSDNLYFRKEDVRVLDGRTSRRAFAVDLSPNIAPCSYDRTYW